MTRMRFRYALRRLYSLTDTQFLKTIQVAFLNTGWVYVYGV
jgi:hypothetical protein